MVSDKSLMKLSLLLSVIGIISIFILNLLIQPEIKSISEITLSDIGHEVIVSGLVDSISIKDSNIFIAMKDSNNKNSAIKVVMFANTAKNYPVAYNLTKNEKITVQGKVENYKGELEIVVNSIEII